MRGCLAALRRSQAAPRRGQAVASDLRCSSVQSWFFSRFYRFVRKNLTVTPIPISFSPTRSIRQILSYFQISKTAYPRITYFPKTLKITFSQNLNFHQSNSKIGSNHCTMKVLRFEHCFLHQFNRFPSSNQQFLTLTLILKLSQTIPTTC